MSRASNQFPTQQGISTTETILLECSRSNSLIDQNNLKGGEENASWINQTGNFQVRKGDMLSVEMVALNLSQTTSPMEFSGYNVILEGSQEKPYVDNRVVLEVGYYINNNQAYTCNLPLLLDKPVNNTAGCTKIYVNNVPDYNVAPNVVSPLVAHTSINQYPGFGLGFGWGYNNNDANGVPAFQHPATVANGLPQAASYNCYRIVGFTGPDYNVGILAIPNTPQFTMINSIVLERDKPGAIPPSTYANSLTSYKTFLEWKSDATTGDVPMLGKVGMEVNVEFQDGTIDSSGYKVVDIKRNTAIFPGEAAVDEERVQICFGIGPATGPNAGAGGWRIPDAVLPGASMCFSTPEIRYNDIFRSQGLANWNQLPALGDSNWTQSRQNSGITDFFSNGLQGYVTTEAGGLNSDNWIRSEGLATLNYSYPHTISTTPKWDASGSGKLTDPVFGMSFLKAGGIGSSNRQQGTDNIPYILLRNDNMGTQSKANCESLGRYNTWCPDLAPLTSFIVLEATDLLMDATALAAKINEKLHASLPGVGNNTNDINSYHTNVYGFTKRYKKSSQLLPFVQTAGYWPILPYQQTDGILRGTGAAGDIDTGGGGFGHIKTVPVPPAVIPADEQPPYPYSILTYRNNQLWDKIDTYFAGGTKQIIPANIQPGWDCLAMVGYNNNITLNMNKYAIDRQAAGDLYPSFETTYLRTCKRPPDYFGDACSWNNVINGNKGVKDLYKHLWGDIFNKIPVWDGNVWDAVPPIMTPATSRNYNRPIILNSQLQFTVCGGQLVNVQPEPPVAAPPIPQLKFFGENTFQSTVLIKNQMIFTNIYYDEKALIETEGDQAYRTVLAGGITKLLEKLVKRQRDYEIFINTSNTSANTYEKQRQDITGYAIKLDLGMTDDQLTDKWSATNATVPAVPTRWQWDSNSIPLQYQAGAHPSYLDLSVALNPRTLNPTDTSTAFGSGNTIEQCPPLQANPPENSHYDWNPNQNTGRPLGNIWIQSRYDPNWLQTSNTGGETLPYPDSHNPQLPVSAELVDNICSFKTPKGTSWADDTWSRENDMGIYPYQYTDDNTPPRTHIFMAFRVATPYKAANSTVINSQITNTWRIGRLSYGLPFGFSQSEYDNYQIIPMNPDKRKVALEEITAVNGNLGNLLPGPGPPANGVSPWQLNTSLIQNCNGYIAVGADNPTFEYNLTKSRMELSKTYKPTQLSPFNTSSNDGTSSTLNSDLPSLGERVAIFNDICPDAVYSPQNQRQNQAQPVTTPLCSGGGIEKNQNQRSEETGIYIYKVWLPDENWNPPTDINLYSYWSNNSPESSSGPDGSRFPLPIAVPPVRNGPNYNSTPQSFTTTQSTYKYRDNQDNTENNREAIIAGMVEATPENYKGCLLSKLGFELEQFMPQQGRQWNRYSINGYNNPQPDLIVTQNTKPLILNCQSNLTLNPAFNVEYHVNPTIADSIEEVSAIQGYTKTTTQPDLVTSQPDLVTPQPDLVTPQPDIVTPQPDLETVIPAVPSYIIYTPQPDLETVIPAVPASSIIHNTAFDNYTEQLVSTDLNQSGANNSARTINLAVPIYQYYMKFTDDGGAGNYTKNNNRTLTFDSGAGNYIWVRFNSFKFEHANSNMYDRAGMTSADVLSDLPLASANLNTTTAPLLSPALINSVTTNPIGVWSSSYGSSSNGYILPSRSDTTPIRGSNFAPNVGVWFQIKARYMRFWFFSDGSVQDNGWNMDICVEDRTAAVPSYIQYTPQPDLETVVPEVPSYISYTPQPDIVTPQSDIITPQPDLITPQPNLVTPQPDLVEVFPTVPAYLSRVSAAKSVDSGLPNYGLGFSNGQPVVVASDDNILTATNPIESTNSPFFQIYSTICPNNYLDNGTKKGILFYCMKNYQSGNYSYGYGSTFAHTATKDYNLDYITTEIRNPISGRLMRVLQSNSVITYKITRPLVLAPDVYGPDGEPIDPEGDPLAQNVNVDVDGMFNLVAPAAGGGVPAPIPTPPEDQEPVYFYNDNNEVINLDSNALLAEEKQELAEGFRNNPAFEGQRVGLGEESQFQSNPLVEQALRLPSQDPNQDETKGESKQDSGAGQLFDPFQQDIIEAGIIQQATETAQEAAMIARVKQEVGPDASKAVMDRMLADFKARVGGAVDKGELRSDLMKGGKSGRVKGGKGDSGGAAGGGDESARREQIERDRKIREQQDKDFKESEDRDKKK